MTHRNWPTCTVISLTPIVLCSILEANMLSFFFLLFMDLNIWLKYLSRVLCVINLRLRNNMKNKSNPLYCPTVQTQKSKPFPFFQCSEPHAWVQIIFHIGISPGLGFCTDFLWQCQQMYWVSSEMDSEETA